MNELSSENVDKCKNFFGTEINIFNEDFLVLNEPFKPDIIIGNPPYQKSNKKTNKSRGGSSNLYLDFIKKSMDVLNDHGYLVFITPQNWRKIGNPVFNLFIQNDLRHVSLNYSPFKGVKTDFYVLQKSVLKNSSGIECYDKKGILLSQSEIILKDIEFIPTLYNQTIKDILGKIKTLGVKRDIVLSCFCHKTRHIVSKNKSKYPLYNTSANPFGLYTNVKHPDQNNKKVILSCSGKLSPFYDKGKYGTTQDSMYYIVKSDFDGDQLVNILNTSLYKFIVGICTWGNFRNEKKLFECLRFPLISDVIDDDFVNNFFRLTEKEKIEINMGFT
jgi:hypothetical protein